MSSEVSEAYMTSADQIHTAHKKLGMFSFLYDVEVNLLALQVNLI